MWQFNQHRWTGGLLDRDLMGGQDLQKYFQGATKLENFFVRRQGCISKRRGTNFLAKITNLLGSILHSKTPVDGISILHNILTSCGLTPATPEHGEFRRYVDSDGNNVAYIVRFGNIPIRYWCYGYASYFGELSLLCSVSGFSGYHFCSTTNDISKGNINGLVLTKVDIPLRQPKSVDKTKLIPIVYERDYGYYALFSGGRAFVIGKDGIRLMNGSYTNTIADSFYCQSLQQTIYYNADEDYNPDKDESGSAVYTGTKPFYIKTTGYDTLQAAFNHANANDIIYVNDQVPYLSSFDASKSYAIGDTCLYLGVPYRCITAHAASAFPPAKWTRMGSREVVDNNPTTTNITCNFTVTLDLNGHNLKMCNSSYCFNVNGGSSTVFKIRNTGARKYAHWDTTQDDIECDIRHNAAAGVSAYMVYLTTAKGSFVLEDGGHLVNQVNSTSYGCVQAAGVNKVTINGGRLEASGNVVAISAATGSMEMNGGAVIARNAAGYCFNVTANANIVFNDGHIEAKALTGDSYLVTTGGTTSPVVVNKGTFVQNSVTGRLFNANTIVHGGAFKSAGYGFISNATIDGGWFYITGDKYFCQSGLNMSGGRLYTNANDLIYNGTNKIGAAEISLWGEVIKYDTMEKYYIVPTSEKTTLYNETLTALAASPKYVGYPSFYYLPSYHHQDPTLKESDDLVYVEDCYSVEYRYDSERMLDAYYWYSSSYEAYYEWDGFTHGSYEEEQSQTPVVEAGTVPVSEDLRPFYVNIPYPDDDFEDIGYAQSGDTVFFAHKKYAPISLVINTDSSLTKKTLVFNNSKWKTPRISSVVAGTGGTWGTGSLKTVYYTCTYVKDGVESQPSQPFGYSYKLPWGDGCSLVITCDKGDNAEKPDYFNIYKKDSSGYGIIATVGSEGIITLYPETYTPDGQYDFIAYNGGAKYTLERYLNYAPSSASQGMSNYKCILVGGMHFPNGLVMNFGTQSGIIASTFQVGLDAFRGVGMYWDGCQCYYTGAFFRATLKTRGYDGTVREFQTTLSVTNKGNLNLGANTLAGSTNWSDSTSLKNGVDAYLRVAKFDFTSQLNVAYPRTKSDASNVKNSFDVISFALESFDDEQTMNPCALYIHGVQFSTTYGQNDVFEDDYITPDMSVSPPKYTEHFARSGDYPSCVGLYKQRLCYAASDNQPFSFWMSTVGDLYNFDVHDSIREDDAIEATLDATEFPQINHMLQNRDLLVFADSGEWMIAPSSGNTLSYKTVSAKMESSIGCSKDIVPINIGDEIVFAEQTGETLRAIRYSFTSDGYETQDLSVLSSNIFRNNPIIQMSHKQFPDSTIECVLRDGTIGSLVYMKEQEVVAWSHQILANGWLAKGVATNKALSNGTTSTVLIVSKDSELELWNVRDDAPYTTVRNSLCLDRYEEKLGSQITAALASPYVMVDILTGNIVQFANIDATKTYAIGLPFESRMVSVYPEPNGSAETLQWEIKNLNDCRFRIMDGSSFTVRQFGQGDSDEQTVTLEPTVNNGNVILCNEDAKVYLLGANGIDGRVDLRHTGVYPISILSMGLNYETQPLTGSQG